MGVNLNVDLSDMQAWLLAMFLSEVDFEYVLETTPEHLDMSERRSNAEATLRALRVVHEALMVQGFRHLG